MRANLAVCMLAAGVIAACDMGAMQGDRAPVGAAQLISASAVVQSVDQATREVVLSGPDGGEIAVIAGPEVRNLAQLEAGDTVQLDYYESVAVEMAPADAPDELVSLYTARSPLGAKPGGVAVLTTEMVVELIDYDADSGLARVRTPEGETIGVTVPPGLRTFASARQQGERVAVTVSEALAVSIVEMPA
jgi:hypothetical protein